MERLSIENVMPGIIKKRYAIGGTGSEHFGTIIIY